MSLTGPDGGQAIHNAQARHERESLPEKSRHCQYARTNLEEERGKAGRNTRAADAISPTGARVIPSPSDTEPAWTGRPS